MNDNYGTSAGSYPIPPPPCPPMVAVPPITAAIDANVLALDRLSGIVERLTNRLSSVLADPSPVNEKCTDRQSGVSLVHEQLLMEGEYMSNLSRRLEDIINRVTI